MGRGGWRSQGQCGHPAETMWLPAAPPSLNLWLQPRIVVVALLPGSCRVCGLVCDCPLPGSADPRQEHGSPCFSGQQTTGPGDTRQGADDMDKGEAECREAQAQRPQHVCAQGRLHEAVSAPDCAGGFQLTVSGPGQAHALQCRRLVCCPNVQQALEVGVSRRNRDSQLYH